MRFLVTFVSPKRSARTLQVAAEHARAVGAEIVVLKVVPDAQKVGVVAQLIATDRPMEKATQQVAQAALMLDQQGIAARGVVRVDEVTEGIVRAAIEWHADAVYVGTFQSPDSLRLQNDPIANYLVDRCPANVVLVRQPDPGEEEVPAINLKVPKLKPTYTPGLRGSAAAGASRKRLLLGILLGLLMLFALRFAPTEEVDTSDAALAQRTSATLMDWHISGLWVINCPVAWVRVTNYNTVPIKDITIEYRTYTADGKPLDHGTYTIDGSVAPGATKNFIELYLGLVALESERLTVKLLSVKKA
jgi:nucleotide-binding universal stress UspA family protein